MVYFVIKAQKFEIIICDWICKNVLIGTTTKIQFLNIKATL